MPRTRPLYQAEFRQQIVELARTGKTPAELAREFGCTARTIANWIGAASREVGRTTAMRLGRPLLDKPASPTP